ncbi:MAG: DUF2752 domain-containing protein [Clostridiales Family XIII bacterium]|nr:DUF2752 domain-containing protein [Clostridiales Family XIII bacterium]
MYHFIGCPFRFVTHIPCPGCGFTRAIFATFRLDFRAAFYFNPAWPLVYLWGIIYVIGFYVLVLPKKISRIRGYDLQYVIDVLSKKIAINILLYMSFAIIFAVYFYRLFLHIIP